MMLIILIIIIQIIAILKLLFTAIHRYICNKKNSTHVLVKARNIFDVFYKVMLF